MSDDRDFDGYSYRNDQETADRLRLMLKVGVMPGPGGIPVQVDADTARHLIASVNRAVPPKERSAAGEAWESTGLVAGCAAPPQDSGEDVDHEAEHGPWVGGDGPHVP